METKKTGPQTKVPPKPLFTHHLHLTKVLLRCHHAHGGNWSTTKIYFPSGSYSHPWYFWNLLLKQEETTEILDYKKEKKNKKAFQPFSTVTSINSRFITVHTPTCPQHRERNAQTQQSQHSNRANENGTQHQGSWKYSCSLNRKTTKMITQSGNTIKVALKCHL